MEPTVVWAIILGLAGAWIYIIPIAVNVGALEVAVRHVEYSNMIHLATTYPQFYDDRLAHYAAAVVTIAVALIVAFPMLALREVVLWTTITQLLCLVVGLVMIFLWCPPWFYTWVIIGLT